MTLSGNRCNYVFILQNDEERKAEMEPTVFQEQVVWTMKKLSNKAPDFDTFLTAYPQPSQSCARKFGK